MSVVEAIVRLAAELPDPGSFATITGAATFGGCVALLVAHLGGLSSERTTDLVRAGTLAGFGIGLLGWLLTFAIDRL